jgi:hypothetical protein
MDRVSIKSSTLTAIADAIRTRKGETEKYKPSEMAAVILTLPSGPPEGIPEEALVLEYECSYLNYGGRWDWFFENYMNNITVTENIMNMNYAFYSSKLTNIPLDFCFNGGGYGFGCEGIYCNATQLKSIGKITNFKPGGAKEMFASCYNLKNIPEYENVDYSHLSDDYYFQDVDYSQMFFRCYSLRNIPSSLLQGAYNHFLTDEKATKSILYRGFEDCYCLDEIVGVDARVGVGAITTNLFYRTFDNCSRVKNIIFNTDNGTPYSVNLSNQFIDLIWYVGYVNGSQLDYITGYNSGLTSDTRLIGSGSDKTTSPDSWTSLLEYSRYNRASAVATINSLPDCSSGTGNTIRFRGSSGRLTASGAINTMTEEEIAVAVSKGWTVSYT